MLRKFMGVLAGVFAAIVLTAGVAGAQDFPSQTIKIVVPYPPGGSADLIGRMLADQLSKDMGATVIVENKGGASGAIGSEAVARAEPDGYTVLIGLADTHAIGPAVNKNLPYDPIEDFTPVSLLARQPLALAVGPSVKAEDFKTFVEAAKAKPNSVTFASNGVGGIQHLSMALLSSLAGFQAVHVPYPGSGPAMADVMGGHVDAIFISLQGGAASFNSGKMRPLAISAPERLKVAPDLPTFAEQGLADFKSQQWYGLFAPAGLPDNVLQKLNEAAVKAMKNPNISDKLESAGTQVVAGTSADFASFLKDQISMWKKVAAQNDIAVK